jgi:deoxycytidine triphosphate deaminase
MILSSRSILDAINSGKWTYKNQFTECSDTSKLVHGPNSIDVSLSDVFLVPDQNLMEESWISYIDLQKDTLDDEMGRPIPLGEKLFQKVQSDEYILKPGEFILSSVNEAFNCMNPLVIDRVERYFAPMYEGRSTIARIGVQSHISAAFGDYGFNGSFTLEIVNNSPWPIRLFTGMRIGQVYFVEVDSAVKDHPYNGYDQTDGLPQAPRLGSNRV